MGSYKVIYIPYYDSNPYQKLLSDNLRIFGVDVDAGRILEFFSVVNISLLFNVIRNPRVDLIHLHWQHPFLIGNSRVKTIVKSLLFISQLVIIRICRIKIVWTVHNLKNHENKYKKLEIFFSRILARLCDGIIAHCEAAKRDIQRVFNLKKDNIAVIPIGSYDVYKNTVSQQEARNRLNLSPTDLTFLYFGLIRPYKGLLELIESFQKLDGSYTKLIIAGKPLDEELAKLISKKAEGDTNIRLILRFIPDDEIQVYLNAADIIILPFRNILSTSSAILGMSFGKAIIAPRLGCIPEILDSSGSFLYEPNEQDGLLNAMKRAMASRTVLLEMGKYNLASSQKLDWRDIAASTYKVYKRCLNR